MEIALLQTILPILPLLRLTSCLLPNHKTAELSRLHFAIRTHQRDSWSHSEPKTRRSSEGHLRLDLRRRQERRQETSCKESASN